MSEPKCDLASLKGLNNKNVVAEIFTCFDSIKIAGRLRIDEKKNVLHIGKWIILDLKTLRNVEEIDYVYCEGGEE
ncbi:MAG: hypothetical protein ACP5OE_09725 [Thermodesulfobium sp.]